MSENNKKIVNEVNDAFANNRVEDFFKHCSDDVVWRMIGEKTNKRHQGDPRMDVADGRIGTAEIHRRRHNMPRATR